MEHEFEKYLYASFKKLVDKYGFIKSTEQSDERAYSIEYFSDTFIIKLVQYWREFYVSLYKTGEPENGVNLFNLLSYLNQTSSDVPQSKFFTEEKDMVECYKKQFAYIVDTIDDNFLAIYEFFKSDDYESKMAEIERFMINKYPNLFKRG